MGLETGTYVSDLVATNPLSTDLVSVGDDHVRLLKSVVKATLPNGDRAQYFKRSATKTANYVILSTDMEKSFSGDATAGGISLTLPALAVGNDGWACEIIKSDSSANTVTVVGTINGETNIVLKKQYQTIRLLWTGTAWLAFFPIVFRDGTFVLPIGTTATRPATPQKGAIWYNDTTGFVEYSNNTSWFPLLVSLSGAQMQYGAVINGTIVESRAANAATFALKTLAGNDPSISDPVLIAFRSPTYGSGAYVYRTVTAALSLVLSSGSNLGVTVNSTPFKVWFVLFDDAGTVRMGAINCLSGLDTYPLGEFPIASSFAEGGVGGADSAHIYYTGTAVSLKSFVPLGYASYETGLATAGAWASAPTRIQLFGPGVPLPSETVQTRFSPTGASATGTTLVPIDDTIPQNTEGDQYMSHFINTISGANLLQVEVLAFLASNQTSSTIIYSIFQDAVANALATGSNINSLASAPVGCFLEYTKLAGVANTTVTFKFRAGAAVAGTVTFNGAAGARRYGGVMGSYMKIREIAA